MKTDLQDKISTQRDLCTESDIEVKRCKQALEIAESASAGRHGHLGELLELERKQSLMRFWQGRSGNLTIPLVGYVGRQKNTHEQTQS